MWLGVTFNGWAADVCGPGRIALERDLRELYRRHFPVALAQAELESRKAFRARRNGDMRVAAESFDEEPRAVRKRRVTLTYDVFERMCLQAMLEVCHRVKDYRVEPDVRDRVANVADTLRKRILGLGGARALEAVRRRQALEKAQRLIKEGRQTGNRALEMEGERIKARETATKAARKAARAAARAQGREEAVERARLQAGDIVAPWGDPVGGLRREH